MSAPALIEALDRAARDIISGLPLRAGYTYSRAVVLRDRLLGVQRRVEEAQRLAAGDPDVLGSSWLPEYLVELARVEVRDVDGLAPQPVSGTLTLSYHPTDGVVAVLHYRWTTRYLPESDDGLIPASGGRRMSGTWPAYPQHYARLDELPDALLAPAQAALADVDLGAARSQSEEAIRQVCGRVWWSQWSGPRRSLIGYAEGEDVHIDRLVEVLGIDPELPARLYQELGDLVQAIDAELPREEES